MSMGLGFCPTCGTPRTVADQRFCGVCGSAFATVSQPAPPVALPAPPETSPRESPAPPSWTTPGAAVPAPAPQAVPSYPPGYQGVSSSAAPVVLAATGGHRSRRPLVVLGGLVLAAIVGVFAYMNMNSTSATAADCGSLRGEAGGLTSGSDAYRSNVQAQVAAGCLVYMSSGSALYRVDTASGATVKVGDYRQVGGGMWDIALAPDGTMYGLASQGAELVAIDRWTAATIDIGPTKHDMNALTVMPNGKMYGLGGAALYVVDPHSGAATEIGPTGYGSAGDLTSDGSGSLLLASRVLVRVDPSTGSAQAIGTADFSNVLGLTMTATGLYGGTNNGELLSINVSTGEYHVIASGLPAWTGMG